MLNLLQVYTIFLSWWDIDFNRVLNWKAYLPLHTFVLFFEECNKGELPLYDTKECQSNGYTCVHSDGSACCSGRQQETRPCVPCDETRLKKTDGLQYTTPGACDAAQGTYCMSISHGIL